MARKCEQYIAHKKRRCNFEVKPGFAFCGNHMPNALQPERRRVPCPWGYPHTCFESEVERHKFKCPSHAHDMKNKAQAYVQHNVNAGPAEDAAQLNTLDSNSASPGQSPDVSASVRHSHAVAMGPETFARLLQSIEHAFDLVCTDPEQLQPLSPPECEAYLQPDNIRPFSLKHAKQQASIVGHMKQAGLLKAAQQQTFIEFGAGKGYLSSMVADASKARRFVLLDMRSFRMKADRSLKKVDNLSLARLRVDIKDFQPAGVPGLEDGVASWVCIGKHLCGAATDFTLQCCASSLHAGSSFSQPEHQTSIYQPAQTSSGCASAAGPRSHADKPCHSRGSDYTTQSVPSVTSAGAMYQQSGGSDKVGVSRQPAAALNQGSQPAMSDVAQADSLETDEDISGHKADCSGNSRQGIQGLAIATCCHHRCSWQHYVGKPTFQQLGFSPEDFEVMSWMTGWALCGHETPNLEDVSDDQMSTADHETTCNRSEVAHCCDDNAAVMPSESSAQQLGQAQSANDHEKPTAHLADDHVSNLARSERMQLGQKCKRLIDFGRQQWMAAQGFQVKSLLYIQPEISGENRLLVGTL